MDFAQTFQKSGIKYKANIAFAKQEMHNYQVFFANIRRLKW